MSVDNPTHRADDSRLAVLAQRFDDFIENTIPYRKRQDEKFDMIFTKLSEMKTTLDKLPCDGRKLLWDAKMDNIEKNNKNQWTVIGALWATIGACAYSIFEAWIKLWNGGK